MTSRKTQLPTRNSRTPLSSSSPSISQLENSFYRIPNGIIRDVAFLPDQKLDRKQLDNEERIVNLSEKIRDSIGKIRRLSYITPSLIDEKYNSNTYEIRNIQTANAKLNSSFFITEKKTKKPQSITDSLRKEASKNLQKQSTLEFKPLIRKRDRRNAFSDLRGINNYVHVMPIQSKDFIPYWIRDRDDFLKIYY